MESYEEELQRLTKGLFGVESGADSEAAVAAFAEFRDRSPETLAALEAWVSSWASHLIELCQSGQIGSAMPAVHILRVLLGLLEQGLSFADGLESLAMHATVSGNLDSALPLQHGACEIRHRLSPNSLALASAFGNFGIIWQEKGNLDEALRFQELAKNIQERLAPDSLALASTFGNLGTIWHEKGDLGEALRFQEMAKNIQVRLAPDSLTLARTYGNLGIIWRHEGKLDEALRFQELARKIEERLAPDSLALASTFGNLGIIWQQKGNLDEALRFQELGRKIKERLAPDSLTLAGTFGNLGIIWYEKGDRHKALSFLEMAQKIQERLAPDSLTLAGTYGNLGNMWQEAGNLDEALRFQELARKIEERLAPESLAFASTFVNLGNIWQQKGNLDEALRHQDRAVDIYARLAPISRYRAVAIAGWLRTLQRLAAKRELEPSDLLSGYEKAWNAIADIVSGIHVIPEARVFLDRYAWIAREYAQILDATGERFQAFLVREQAENLYLRLSLARRLRDERVAEIQAEIATAHSAVAELQTQIENTRDDESRVVLKAAQDEKVNERERLRGEAQRLLDERLGFQDVPQDAFSEVLGVDGVYLSYYVSEKETVLYVVDHEGLDLLTIPAGSVPPEEGEMHRHWEDLLPSDSDNPWFVRNWIENRTPGVVSFFLPERAQKRIAEAVIRAAAKGEVPTIAISRDGILGTVAIGHLPVMTEEGPVPLAQLADVTYVNSMGHLKMAQQYGGRPGTNAAVVGVSDHDDTPEPLEPDEDPPRSRARTRLRGVEHHNLPAVRAETEHVAGLYQTGPLLNERAGKAEVLASMQAAAVIAVASHGGADPDDPMASSIILFPPGEKEGRLPGYEIAQEKLNAAVMTVSCCVTGRAGRYAGQELASFGYAVQLSGIPATVVAQWPVLDEDAKEFMCAFHDAFATGVTVGDAMRAAMKRVGVAAWAHFVVIGNPKARRRATN